MGPFTSEQLTQFFHRVRYPVSHHATDRLTFLTELQKHALVWIPFETLSLHYSIARQVSLNPEDLFEKIVVKERGGYCLENNTLFLAVLESLGFQTMRVVCRITTATRGVYDGSWRPMSVSTSFLT
jgi:arylamine N-acetyltransferase